MPQTRLQAKKAAYDRLDALECDDEDPQEEEFANLVRGSRTRKRSDNSISAPRPAPSLRQSNSPEGRASDCENTMRGTSKASKAIKPSESVDRTSPVLSASDNAVTSVRHPGPTKPYIPTPASGRRIVTPVTAQYNEESLSSTSLGSSRVPLPPPDQTQATPPFLQPGDINAENYMSALPARILGKEKVQPLRKVPESQRLFSGLYFLFLPEDDICGVRQIRIRSALESGAVWVQAWRDGVTHIVADDRFTYNEVMKYLELQALPTGVVLVNEYYPPFCSTSGSLLDHEQFRFLLKGHPVKLSAAVSPPKVPVRRRFDRSLLPLKLDRSWYGRSKERVSQTSTDSIGEVDRISNDSSCDIVPAAETAPRPYVEGKVRKRDALEDAIEEAKNLVELPLSDDEDDLSSTPTARCSTRPTEPSPLMSIQNPSVPGASFACQRCPVSSPNVNSNTIRILQQMSDYYTQHADNFRAIGYRRAISSLRAANDRRIETCSQALALPHVGHRLALKIEEIATTSRLRRLDETLVDETDVLIEKFMGIYGVGLSQARKWVSAGYKSLDDVRKRATLTKDQKVGLAHYEDFKERIPRDEVAAHGTYMRIAVMRINTSLKVQIMGSYRRGTESSGDVDLLISHPTYTLHHLRSMLVKQLVPTLYKAGYMRATLASPTLRAGAKWMGAATLPDLPDLPGGQARPWRRLDILLVEKNEVGSAMLYFTGDAVFNRSLRLLAKKSGWKLNQKGLWDATGRVRDTDGMDERELLKKLGVGWREPSERSCG